MRGICRLCGRKVTANRSSHLRKVHGIDTWKGAVKEYFAKPEEYGLTEEEFNRIPEGAKVHKSIVMVGRLENPKDIRTFKPWFVTTEE